LSTERARPHPDINHHHRDVTGGWLRPAVFGAMDGLVSNLGVISGVTGGDIGHTAVLLAGFAGLVAGALSMAAGEYVSVASQTELARAEIETERIELERAPHAEMQELAELYEARGLEPDLAMAVAQALSRDPESTLEVHVREELGIDPNDLPSPVVASGSSFVAFAVGAAVPLLPFIFGATVLWPSFILCVMGLFACGAAVSRVTTRSWWYSGTRQALIGAGVAVVTFFIGYLVSLVVG
jgi:vacuolar iron transporter family protein